MPNSPFFRPSNPRIAKIKTPQGTRRSTIVVKKNVGGESKDVTLQEQDLEKKTSLLGAYANLCNVTIGAGIVGLVRLQMTLLLLMLSMHLAFDLSCTLLLLYA